MAKKIRKIIFILMIFFCALMIVASKYYSTEYPKQSFDEILYYMSNGVGGTSSNVVQDIIQDNILCLIFLFVFLYIITTSKGKNKVILNLGIRSKKIKIQLYPFKLFSNHKFIYTIVLLIFSCNYFIKGFKIDEYIKYLNMSSTIYEDYYVKADSSYLKFPNKKRNLIFISMESMENTFASKENGGDWDYSVIPELEKLALDEDNVSFSNTDKLGGPYQYTGTTFTTAGLVAQTAGIHLKTTSVTMGDDGYQRYGGKGRYLGNAYSLGDVLKENGYNLEIMIGSDGNFGGRTQYFNTHGNYTMYDYNYAIQSGKMRENEKVWWGYDDETLYKWAKERILDLADKDEPFNFIIQTADTHFPDGYVSRTTKKLYPTQYENVYANSSKLVYNFIQWLERQDFYENTTIVIIGDHLNMQSDFAEKAENDNYNRSIYNVIINSAIKANNSKNRQFSSMDFYPTMLASIGVKIKGDRLGIGTNLFSDVKTISEELGHEYLEEELRKNSNFYNIFLLSSDYYEVEKN